MNRCPPHTILGSPGLWRSMLGNTSNDHRSCHYSTSRVPILSYRLFLISGLFWSTYPFFNLAFPTRTCENLRFPVYLYRIRYIIPSPLFSFSCHGAISIQLWLLFVDMWQYVIPSKSDDISPFLWPVVWGQHLKPKHIPSQIYPSSFEHQNGFQFPEWQNSLYISILHPFYTMVDGAVLFLNHHILYLVYKENIYFHQSLAFETIISQWT